MKKNNITFLLTALLSMVGARALAHDIEVENADGKTIYYRWVNNQTELAVSYRGSNSSLDYNEYSGNVVIPESVIYNGKTYPVTSVEYSAFAYCSGLTSVTIPNSVTTINNYAFAYCPNLTSVIIPNSVTTINIYAFAYCSSLTSVIIPNSVTTIGDNVFRDCINLQYILYLGDLNSQCGSNAKVYHQKDFSRWIVWNSHAFDYTGKDPIATFTYDEMILDFVPTAVMSELKKDVGTYTVNVPFTIANDEVSFQTDIPFTYTIKPAKLTVKVANASRLYGDANPSFSSVYSGFVNNEDESVLTNVGRYITTATETSNVGTYTVKQSGATAQNYIFDYEDGTLTVTKAPLTASVKSCTRKYGEVNPRFEISYVGLKNNESDPAWVTAPTFSTTATPKSDVGEYEITAVGGEAKNYELSSIASGSLTITPAPLIVKANSFSRLYFEENPPLSYLYSGFVSDENESVLTEKPVVKTNATKQSSVGVYPIEIGNASAKNYMLSYENGTLTVNKRQLTVSTKNYTRAYGEENPAFEVAYSGFVNNEGLNVLISKPKASTKATATTDVGVYDITIGNGVAENYAFNYVAGKLTIEKAYQTLSWEQDFSNVKKYDQVELLATASSGLDVTYTVEGDPICSVMKIGNKHFLDCSSEGETVIVAVQKGNKNYWQTTKIYKPIVIKGITGISSASLELDGDAKIFDLSGNRIEKLQRGVNIVRMSNGSLRKVVVK